MLQYIRRSLARNFINYKGWITGRKIVVIESDDWGSIRIPSKRVYDLFLKQGVPLYKSSYCRYDSLASDKDIQALFETLLKFKDRNGNPPVITANTIMANPDFKKIQESDFKEYFYEPFTKTLERYPGREKSFQFWKQGMEAGVFRPQFHGREHLNVKLWMRLLQNNHRIYRQAFSEGFWGIDTFAKPEDPVNILAAFDTLYPDDVQFHKEAIVEGIELFQNIFGYRPESFIAPNYIWDPAHEQVLNEQGIKTLQGMKVQKFPVFNNKKRKMVRRYTGELNRNGQVYMVRNCVFEPALQSPEFDSVDACLKDIANSFLWNRPAIITSHRLNFIGSQDPGNRRRNLNQLSSLLCKILKRWPETEFMSSDRLGNDILTDQIRLCAE